MGFLKNLKKAGENLKKNLDSLSDTLENSDNLKNLKEIFEEKKSRFLDKIDEKLNVSERFNDIKKTGGFSLKDTGSEIKEKEIPDIIESDVSRDEESKIDSDSTVTNEETAAVEEIIVDITDEDSEALTDDLTTDRGNTAVKDPLKIIDEKKSQDDSELKKSMHENKFGEDSLLPAKDKIKSKKEQEMIDFKGKEYIIDGDSLILNKDCNYLESISDDIPLNKKLEIKNLDLSLCDKIHALDRSDIREYPNLEKFLLPASLKIINKGAFRGCKNLKSVKFNEGLESIGEGAFYDTQIEELEFPSTLKKIGENTFLGCKDLKSVKFNEGLESIGKSAFRDTQIEELEFPSTLKKIEAVAFNGCEKLKSVKFNEGLESIGNGAFGDTQIEGLEFPSTLKKIEAVAFDGCKKIKSVKFNEGLESIGVGAFYDIQIEGLEFPSTLKKIEGSAFNGCKKLKSVKFNEGLESIDDSAFEGTQIEELEFPWTLKKIEKKAFKDCKDLKSVKFNEGLESIGDSAFEGTQIEELVFPSTLRMQDDDLVRNIRYVDMSKCKGVNNLKIEISDSTRCVLLPVNLTEIIISGEICLKSKGMIFIPKKLNKIIFKNFRFKIFNYTDKLKSLKEINTSNEFFVKEKFLHSYIQQAKLEECEKLSIQAMPVEYEYFWN